MSENTIVRIDKKIKVRLMWSHGESEWEEVDFRFTISMPAKVKGHAASRGWFEQYDENMHYHADGGLWFEGNVLVDYDGIFALSKEVLDTLDENGFDVENIRRSHE